MEINKCQPIVLNIPEDVRLAYAEHIDLYNFRQEQRRLNDLFGQQQLKEIQLKEEEKKQVEPQEPINNGKERVKAPAEPIDKRSSKIEKVTKLKNKIKEADGPFKKKIQDQVMREIKELNLSKFVTEVAQQIIDSGLQNTRFFVELCLFMQHNYDEFMENLIALLNKHIELIDARQGNFENEAERSTKRKNIARLLGELYCIGLLEKQNDEFILLIQHLIMKPPTAKGSIDNFILNMKVGVTFLQYFAYELFRTNTHTQQLHIIQYPELATVFVQTNPKTSNLSSKVRAKLRDLFKSEYVTVITSLMEQVYNRIKEFTEQSLKEDQKLKEVKEQFIKLKEGYRNTLDYLGLYDPNKVSSDTQQSDIDKIFDLSRMDMEVFNSQLDGEPFDNDEDKQMYDMIPDLRELVPKEILKRDKEALTKALNGGRDETQITEAFFKRLKECMSIQIADELAVDFCYINSKKNRRSIIEEICVYRNNYLLLAPHQCRLMAILSRSFKELDEECTKYVAEQYKAIRNQETYAYDKKQRFVRYICELTKFKVMKPDVIMDVFQGFLDDLISHNIQLSVLLIENCGKFLLRSQESHRRFKFQLEQLSKLRGSKPLSQQLDIQLENAILQLNPNFQQHTKTKKPPSKLKLYLKYLLFDMLNTQTFDIVKTEILRLPHQQAECHQLLYKYLIKLSLKGRFSQMDMAAAIIAVLKPYYPKLVDDLVKFVLDEIKRGLEQNEFTERQGRISLMKFLGEFYNFQIIEHDVIFNMLYLLIDFGHDFDMSRQIQDMIDPPDDTFRITQVVTLLVCVQSYFVKKFKNKLMRYLAFFQRYTLSKQYIPQDVEFSLLDLYESIDQNLRSIRSYKQAEQLCNHLLELEATVQNINYDEELRRMFGAVAVSTDLSIDLLEKRRKEEDAQEAEKQRKIQAELESQFNNLMKESQRETLSKTGPASQPVKKVLPKPMVIKGSERKVIARAVETKGKDQTRKIMKLNQQQELYQKFTNFSN